MQVAQLGVHESVNTVFPPEKLRSYLEGEAPVVRIVTDDELAGCDALVTHGYDRQFIESGIGWLHSIQSGVDRFPFTELEANDIILTNSTGIHDESVGETVVGYLVQFARLLHRYRWSQREAIWDRPEWDEPFTLDGSSVCIIGLGTIGKAIAERATALGMTVTGVKRSVEPIKHVDEVYSKDNLRTAIAETNFVVSAVPLTDETRGLIGGSELEAMRNDAYLINVARGPVIEQQELINALWEDEIAGAALDVFEEEPLPEHSPLWEMENVIVTPHTAAHTRNYFRNVGDIVRKNITRISNDEFIINRIV